MKRLKPLTAAILVAAVLFSPAKAGAISARKGIVLDAVTGRVLYEKRPDEESLIASTTKIMTALVVCQQCNVLDRVKIPAQAVGIEGSSMYLKEGEILTVQELLYGLMLHSGNDAAVALAIYCGGTVEGFVELMNDKARALGLENTHFANPNGLDAPGHHSTARDLAILAAYAMEDPIFARTVSTKQVNCAGRSLTNHNKLLWRVPGAEGVKTGYTKAAGRILVSSASREGRRLICVTIDDPNDWADHAALLEEGFSGYKVETVVEKGSALGSLEVEEGDADRVELLAGEGFAYALAKDERIRILLPQREFVYAPVKAGEKAGTAYLLLGDRVIGKIPLVYGRTVEQKKEEKQSLWDRLWGNR
jgi:D-alanyl-D-alanine carboxypeptidase